MISYPRQIQRVEKQKKDSDSSESDDDDLWEWQGDMGWQQYDTVTSQIIEKAYKQNLV